MVLDLHLEIDNECRLTRNIYHRKDFNFPICHTHNSTTDVTSNVGTVYLPGAPEYTPVFCLVSVAQYLVSLFCILLNIVCVFIPLVLSVLLQIGLPVWYFQLDNHILSLRSRNIYGSNIVKSKH